MPPALGAPPLCSVGVAIIGAEVIGSDVVGSAVSSLCELSGVLADVELLSESPPPPHALRNMVKNSTAARFF